MPNLNKNIKLLGALDLNKIRIGTNTATANVAAATAATPANMILINNFKSLQDLLKIIQNIENNKLSSTDILKTNFDALKSFLLNINKKRAPKGGSHLEELNTIVDDHYVNKNKKIIESLKQKYNINNKTNKAYILEYLKTLLREGRAKSQTEIDLLSLSNAKSVSKQKTSQNTPQITYSQNKSTEEPELKFIPLNNFKFINFADKGWKTL